MGHQCNEDGTPVPTDDPSDLRFAFELARQAWPLIRIEYPLFRAHLQRLGWSASNLPQHVGQIYLCLGCGLGLRKALRTLDELYLPPLYALLHPISADAEFREEVMQRLRDRLFVGSHPRIITYRGDGPLSGWLRIVTVNISRDYLRSLRVERARRSMFPVEAASHSAERYAEVVCSPEDQMLEAHQAMILERCLTGALTQLDDAERRLLHGHFVSGLSIDQLGVLYAVDRSTAARRIQRTLCRVKRRVLEALALWTSEIESSDLARLRDVAANYFRFNAASLLSPAADPATRCAPLP